MARAPDFDLYFDVLGTLDALDVPHVIIGAFAGTSYGITRATVDVDIVVDLAEDQINALAAAYPGPRYYADPEQMRDCVRRGIMFNIIDSSEGLKVDLIPVTMEPGYGWALRNRVRRPLPLGPGGSLQAWLARPEDVIVGKLMAWKEGRSAKHPSDIRDILIAIRTGEEPELTAAFDMADIERWVERLGPEVADLWRELKEVAGFPP